MVVHILGLDLNGSPYFDRSPNFAILAFSSAIVFRVFLTLSSKAIGFLTLVYSSYTCLLSLAFSLSSFTSAPLTARLFF